MEKVVRTSLAMVALVSACTINSPPKATGPGSGSPSPSASPSVSAPESVVVYRANPTFAGLTFRHPASWRPHSYRDSSSFATLIVYLSNQQLHPPCISKHTANGLEITCGWPLAHLAPRSILASWWAGGGPNPAGTFRRLKGTRIGVGGRPAKLSITHAGCRGIGGDLSLDVTVNNFYEFQACIRGPGTRELERQSRALLRSVRFSR